MNEITIDEYHVVDNGKEKPFCVYIVKARINGCQYVTEKRYSQFHALHDELKKQFQTPYFPPKKVRSLQPKVLGKRRQALEEYIQAMFNFNQSRAQVLSFLGIKGQDADQAESSNAEELNQKRLNLPPVFKFRKDYIPDMGKSKIPNIVVEGVLLGLYKS